MDVLFSRLLGNPTSADRIPGGGQDTEEEKWQANLSQWRLQSQPKVLRIQPVGEAVEAKSSKSGSSSSSSTASKSQQVIMGSTTVTKSSLVTQTSTIAGMIAGGDSKSKNNITVLVGSVAGYISVDVDHIRAGDLQWPSKLPRNLPDYLRKILRVIQQRRSGLEEKEQGHTQRLIMIISPLSVAEKVANTRAVSGVLARSR
ncbi:hypothetical protein L218DRAFT_948644 [Marasmius fiardii PR-910]|nr:hypothetical protein L218DRAFT_948644 [Marasmius fiardii PR-910]